MQVRTLAIVQVIAPLYCLTPWAEPRSLVVVVALDELVEGDFGMWGDEGRVNLQHNAFAIFQTIHVSQLYQSNVYFCLPTPTIPAKSILTDPAHPPTAAYSGHMLPASSVSIWTILVSTSSVLTR
jgi:hypothetical protein